MELLSLPVSDQDHATGPADAAVTLVEYGDFECPDCLQAYPEVKAWQEAFGDQLRFVFRHMPLNQVYPIHPHATRAALAAEAAAAQGKFWEMHDLLFENQEHLEDADLVGYAAQLGLDANQFAADMNAAATSELVAAHVASGTASGVTSTPMFFLNGERVEASRDYAALAERIGILLA